MNDKEFLTILEDDMRANLFKLHNLKFVHKDIKPPNMVYCPKLAKFMFVDFGFTHAVKETFDEKTPVIECAGSPDYVLRELRVLLLSKKNFKLKINMYHNDLFGLQKSIMEIKADLSQP